MKKPILGIAMALFLASGAHSEPDIGELVPRSDRAEWLYQLMIGEIAGRRGDLATALAAYQEVVAQIDDPQVAARATAIALFANDAQALPLAKRWLQLAPESPDARRALLQAQLRFDEPDMALIHELVTLVRPVEEQAGYNELIRLLRQVSDAEKAWTIMAQVASIINHPIARYFEAVFAESAEAREAALVALDQAKQGGLNPALIGLFRARLRVELDQAPAALTELKELVEQFPENRELRMGYGRLLVGQQQFDEAIAQFEQILETHPQEGDALFALGILNTQREEFAAAEGYFQRLLVLDERRVQALLELGRLAEQQGEVEQAVRWYERVATDSQADDQTIFESRLRIGALLAQQGNLAEFDAYFEAVRAELSPPWSINWTLAQVEILRSQRAFAPAFALLTQLLETDPDNTDLLYSRALIAERLNRIDVLEQDLKRILARDPDNPQTLNALGYTWADRKMNLEQAFDFIQRAHAQLPDDGAITDSMGWIHYRLGNYEEALKYLERAYELDPQGEIAAHWIEVLWVVGETEAARTLFEASMERYPDDEHLNKIRGLFDL